MRFPSRPCGALAAATAGALLALAGCARPAPKPNVLFLVADDLRPALGSYGNPVVQSPHIDGLAAAGVRFDRAYAQFPLCSPSRVSLLLGRYPAATGVLDNAAFFRDLDPEAVTLPQHFRRHGYVALRAGKIFHEGVEDEASWDAGPGLRDGDAERLSWEALQERRAAGAREWGFDLERPWKPVRGKGENLLDARIAAQAIELLEQYRDRPFFLGVGFLKPHTPFLCPKRFFDLYKPKAMPLPPDFAPRPTVGPGVPAAALTQRNGDLLSGDTRITKLEARAATAAYYACVSATDDQVGRVLSALDRLGLRERTLVVFLGDHGFHLGEKGKWSKHGSLYEVGTRVPLVIAGPGVPAGGVSPRTVELVDVYPTLVELAGLPMPAGLHGQSLLPLLRDPSAPWEHPAFSATTNPAGRSIRTERWRYTEWEGEDGGAELYDETADPHELTNRVRDPEHRQIVAALQRRLAEANP